MMYRGGSNWLTWILFFFIGTSAIGAITTFLGTTLGFPFAWTSALYLPLLGIGIFLIYRGYPIQTWLLVGAIFFILVAIIAIVRGFVISEPEFAAVIPEAYRDAGNSSYDEWFDYNDYGTDLDLDNDYFLISPYEYEEVYLRIFFPALETPGGQWAFVDGRVRASGGLRGTFRANLYDNPINVENVILETGLPADEAFPYLTIWMPLDARSVGREIMLETTLTVAIPATGSEAVEETMTRITNLFYPSADFATAQLDYYNYQRAKDVVEGPTWLLLSALSGVAAVGSVLLVRNGALQPGAGSFVVQVQRLNGLQRLGVEAHLLANISNATAERGVFLGVVNAQSPAGRGGLRSGDVLTEFAGKAINSPRELNRAAGRIQRGEVAEITVLRDGLPVQVFVKF